MSWLYIGTFGSFIGYSAAFPLLLKTQFPAITVGIAFLGPLVGSVARPLGGLLADKVGGARVTLWNFVVMGAATIGVMHYVEIKSFSGFLVMFLILFVTTGIGNGSTFRMIPSIFRAEKLREAKGLGDAARALGLSRRPVSRVPPCSASHRRSAPVADTSSRAASARRLPPPADPIWCWEYF
jgi:NNP family nitrate/nitrite transporter-like MFS transporter